MKDSLNSIINTFNTIIKSNEKNESKAVDFRKVFERVLRYLLNIERGENHMLSELIIRLRSHPEIFRKQLLPKARVLSTFFNDWSHDRPETLYDDELNKHQIKLKEFIEKAFDTRIEDVKTPSIVRQITPGIELKSYFKIAKNWYRKNKIIEVRFKRGVYQNNIYRYDHDKVYDRTLYHLKQLPCWDNDGYYSSSSNIPGFAIDYVTKIL